MSRRKMSIAITLVFILGVGAGGSMIAQDLSAMTEREQAPALPIEDRRDLHGDALPSGASTRLGTIRFRNSDGFETLAYTPDGKVLVSGGWGGAAVWDAATGKQLRRVGTALPNTFGPASLSSDGKRVAVGGWGPAKDTAGAVYEVASGRRLYPFGNRGGAQSFARFSPDAKVLAVYGTDNDIQLHDAQTGKRLRALAGHKAEGVGNPVNDVVFSPDSKRLISAGSDGTIRQWDVATGAEKLQLNGGPDGVNTLALSLDGTLLVIQAWVKTERSPGQFWRKTENHLRVWNVTTGKETGQIHVPSRADETGQEFISLLGFTPDGKALLTSGPDEALRGWDVRTAKELFKHKYPDGPPRAIAFAPGGKTMAGVENFRAVRIREYPGGRELFPVDGHCNAIEGIAVAPTGKTLATAEEGGTILLWDPATSRLQGRLAAPKRPRTLLFSSDARTLFTAGYDQPLQAWDATTGKERWRLQAHHDSATRLTLAPDGGTLAWTGKPNTIVLIEAATGKAVRELRGPEGEPARALLWCRRCDTARLG